MISVVEWSSTSSLFRIRLTHEDLLQLRTELLQTIGEVDVEEKEIARLIDVTSNQAVAGVALLEREHQRDKLTAMQNSQAESLRMHGLTEDPIVVPVQMVTQQGIAGYVFRRQDTHFDRVPIHEKHRDQHFVDVERDGAVSPANRIAWRGTDGMLPALRNQTAAPMNSHGHSHPHRH